MSIHPLGQTVEIFGIDSPTNGRSCEEHRICGHVLQEDVIVRFRKVQVLIKEKEESAIAAFWVSDGIDRCRVGYLPRHHVKHWKRLEGCLAQIIEVYGEDTDSPTKRQKHHHNSGVAVAALISGPFLPNQKYHQLHPRNASPKHRRNTKKKKKRSHHMIMKMRINLRITI